MAENKVRFPKTSAEIDCGEFGYPGVRIKAWVNPTRRVLNLLNYDVPEDFDKLGREERENMLDGLDQRYAEALTYIVLDHNLEGIDFSSKESILEAMDMEMERDFVTSLVRRVFELRSAALEEEEANLKED